MKKTMRKLFSVVLTLVLVMGAIPFGAFATVDLSTALADLADAQSKLSDATSALAAAKNDVTTAESDKALAKAAWDAAKLDAASKKKIYDETLAAKGDADADTATAKAEWEAAVAEASAREAEYNTADSELATKKVALGSAQSNYDAYKALVDARQKVVDDLQKPSSDSGSSSTGSGSGSSSSTGSTDSSSGSKDDIFDASTDTTKPADKLTDYTKFHEDVILKIYCDTTVGTVKKEVNITNGIAADGKVTMNEVKSVVKYYFNAIDADTGITYDGLYPVQGNWVLDYANDQKYDTIDGLYEAAANKTVIIRVMIGNAKLASSSGSSSSSNADSSNPKTGDDIYMAVTAMALSASALAVGCYFFMKKRAA